jgi:hypothetical protein
MPLATASQILQSFSLDMLLLPLDSNFGAPNRTGYSSVTLTATAASVGANTLTVSYGSVTNAPTPLINAGTALSFFSAGAKSRQQAVVVADVGSTATTGLTVSPLLRPISTGATATLVYQQSTLLTNGATELLPLAGIQTMDLNNQETQVDTTHFGSGSGSEAAIVRFNRSYSVSGIALIGDECLETVVKPAAGFDSGRIGREVYAITTMPDGERIAGVAKIMALNLPANQNEVKKYSFTLMYQGSAYEWTPPYSNF